MCALIQLYMHVYASVAGRHTLRRKEQRCPPCAQPCEIPSQCSNTKSQISFSHCRAQAYIYYFVFEHGKGTAIFVVYTFEHPYQQRCANKIYNQTLIPYLQPICFQNISHTFSLLAAIHLFISSRDEIKDFCSMDKKTGRRYVLRLPFYTINHRKYSSTKKHPHMGC